MSFSFTVWKLTPFDAFVLISVFWFFGFFVHAGEAPASNMNRAAYLKDFIPELQAQWPANRIINIVCLGDSITAGYLQTPLVTRTRSYPALLAAWLEETFPHSTVNVINVGIGGDTTTGGLARLQRDVTNHQPELVTVCYGMNDFGGLSVAQFENNLREIVNQLQKAQIKWIVLMTTMPHVSGGEKQKPYMEAIGKVAQEMKVGFADVYGRYQKLLAKKPDPKTIWSNGINHPTYEGHKIFFEALVELFQQAAAAQPTHK